MANAPTADGPKDGRRAPLVYEHEGSGGITIGGSARIAVAITARPPDSPTHTDTQKETDR